jgi:hypothetical protein
MRGGHKVAPFFGTILQSDCLSPRLTCRHEVAAKGLFPGEIVNPANKRSADGHAVQIVIFSFPPADGSEAFARLSKFNDCRRDKFNAHHSPRSGPWSWLRAFSRHLSRDSHVIANIYWKTMAENRP